MRSVAETLQNGVRRAGEAVRRNRTVVFFPDQRRARHRAASVVNGVNWGVRTIPLRLPPEAAEFLRGGAFSDVAQGVTITSPVAALCFNPAGQQATVVAGAARRRSPATT